MRDIIKTYSIREECFKNIGGTSLIFTNTEISLLFGIKCDSKPLLKLSYNLKPKTQFIKRHFKDHKMLTNPFWRIVLKMLLWGKLLQTLKTLLEFCAYMCVQHYFFRFVDTLWGGVSSTMLRTWRKSKDYDWTGAIRQTLKSSIKSLPPRKVKGCVLLLPVSVIVTKFTTSISASNSDILTCFSVLQYWICEHACWWKLSEISIPWFVKWDLENLYRMIKGLAVDKIKVTKAARAKTKDMRLKNLGIFRNSKDFSA